MRFDAEESCKNCPRCGNIFIEKLNRKGKKKVEKRKKFTGNFIEVGGKRCQKCDFSEKSTISNIKLKCNCPEPETTFHRGKNVWICYSYKGKK